MFDPPASPSPSQHSTSLRYQDLPRLLHQPDLDDLASLCRAHEVENYIFVSDDGKIKIAHDLNLLKRKSYFKGKNGETYHHTDYVRPDIVVAKDENVVTILEAKVYPATMRSCRSSKISSLFRRVPLR